MPDRGSIHVVCLLMWSVGRRINTKDESFYNGYSTENLLPEGALLCLAFGTYLLESTNTDTPFPISVLPSTDPWLASGTSCYTLSRGPHSPMKKMRPLGATWLVHPRGRFSSLFCSVLFVFWFCGCGRNIQLYLTPSNQIAYDENRYQVIIRTPY